MALVDDQKLRECKYHKVYVSNIYMLPVPLDLFHMLSKFPK